MLPRLLASIAAGEFATFVGRMRTAAVFYAIAGFVALCGVVFLLGAAYIAAAERWGALEAAIWFGVGFLVLSVLMLIVQKFVARAQIRRSARRRSADLRALGTTALVAFLPSLLLRRSVLGTLLLPLAAVIGYMIYEENRNASDEDDLEEDDD